MNDANEILVLVRYLSALGTGGALAGFIFYFYRRDVINGLKGVSQERDTMLVAIKENSAVMSRLAESMNMNTRTLENLAAFCRYRGPGEPYRDQGGP